MLHVIEDFFFKARTENSIPSVENFVSHLKGGDKYIHGVCMYVYIISTCAYFSKRMLKLYKTFIYLYADNFNRLL